jgi:hypothetical protein
VRAQYKGDNPADCIEIGSVGPCSQGECGMEATAGKSGAVKVVYTYTYGCKNTFTLSMSPGVAPAPGQVTSNECSYTASWAGIVSGGGSWVIDIPTIAVVCAFFGALAGGTGFNIKKRQMKGAEAVPFIGFWRALPGLFKDGTMFSYVHGREFSLMVRSPPPLSPTVELRVPATSFRLHTFAYLRCTRRP